MPYTLRNVATDPRFAGKRAKAQKMQMEPLIAGLRVRLGQTVTITDEQYAVNEVNINLAVEHGVLELVGHPAESTESLEEETVKELRAKAEHLGLELPSNMLRDDIIKAIQEFEGSLSREDLVDSTEYLDEFTKEELTDTAKLLEVDAPTTKNKGELIEAIQDREKEGAPVTSKEESSKPKSGKTGRRRNKK